jgi:hypothetical protein
MEYFSDVNGWIGVGIGLLIFLLGYMKGVGKARALAPHIIDSTIQNLIDNGFIKTRKTLKDGKWQEDILRYDEEV